MVSSLTAGRSACLVSEGVLSGKQCFGIRTRSTTCVRVVFELYIFILTPSERAIRLWREIFSKLIEKPENKMRLFLQGLHERTKILESN